MVEIKEQQGQQKPPDANEQCHVEITEDAESAVKQQTPHIKCPSCQKYFETNHSLAKHIGPLIAEGLGGSPLNGAPFGFNQISQAFLQ